MTVTEPLSVNFTALDISLYKTCFRRSGSPFDKVVEACAMTDKVTPFSAAIGLNTRSAELASCRMSMTPS